MMAPVSARKPMLPLTPWGQREGLFQKLDANGDGKIGRDEFKRAYQGEVDKAFDRLDANKDGGVDRGEFATQRVGIRSNEMSGLERLARGFVAPFLGIADFFVRAVQNPKATLTDIWL